MGSSKSKQEPTDPSKDPPPPDSESVSDVVDIDPPDNGPFYCALCVWLGTMYDRFDKPFMTFFIL